MTEIRVNELEHARQGALEVARRSARENRPGYLTGRVVGLDEADSRRIVVDFGGSPISVLSGPGRWVPGSLVAVDVDGQNRPTRVRGAVTDAPAEHVEVEGEPVEPVVSWAGTALEPREITEEERARIKETASAVDKTRADLADASETLGELAGQIADAEYDIAQVRGSVNSKNTITVSDRAPQAGEPGTAPGDVWWVVDSQGTVVEQYRWDGDQWVLTMLDNDVLAGLDVHKLQVTGTANIDQAVIDKIWSEVVLAKLVVAEKIITGQALVDGAVSARTLNVVPADGQGGTVLTGTKIGMVNSDGTGMMDLSVDAENYLAFYRDEAVNFSVSADGALTAQDVSANANLFYRGAELSELLESFARGTVYATAREAGPHRIQNAAYTSRLAYIQAQRPETDRRWRIWATYEAMGNSSTGVDSWNLFVFAFNGGQHYDQATWQIIEQGYQRVPGTSLYDHRLLVAEVRAHSLPWSEAGNGIFSINMSNADGSSFNVRNIRFWIEDVGSSAAATASPSTTWIRPDATSDAAPTPTEQRHTSTWNMSGFQNYRAGVRLSHASGNIAGGNYGGEWRGVMFFPHASIRSALSGATINKVEIYLQNAHTYAYSGSTVLIGSHNYATAPASSPAVAARTSQHFGRGQGRWVTLPAAVGTGFANGTIKGLAVYGGSTANYATWTPGAVKLRVSYTK